MVYPFPLTKLTKASLIPLVFQVYCKMKRSNANILEDQNRKRWKISFSLASPDSDGLCITRNLNGHQGRAWHAGQLRPAGLTQEPSLFVMAWLWHSFMWMEETEQLLRDAEEQRYSNNKAINPTTIYWMATRCQAWLWGTGLEKGQQVPGRLYPHKVSTSPSNRHKSEGNGRGHMKCQCRHKKQKIWTDYIQLKSWIHYQKYQKALSKTFLLHPK